MKNSVKRNFTAIMSLGLLLTACSNAAPTPHHVAAAPVPTAATISNAGAPLPTSDARQVARGNQLYAQHCVACHGVQLQGQPNWATPTVGVILAPPLNDAGHAWDHSDVELRRAILRGSVGKDPAGNPFMPAFADKLQPDELEAVLAFLKSSWNTPHRLRQFTLSQSR